MNSNYPYQWQVGYSSSFTIINDFTRYFIFSNATLMQNLEFCIKVALENMKLSQRLMLRLFFLNAPNLRNYINSFGLGSPCFHHKAL